MVDFCFYQYYATVDSGNDFEEDCYPWLSKENVEDRTEEDLSGLPEMVSSGHSVGGVVYSTIPGTKVNHRLTAGTVLQLIVKSLELKAETINLIHVKYCGIIIVHGGPMFMAFVGNPCP